MDKVSQTDKMRVALEAVQHYLLTVPEGAHKEILYQIDDALTAYRFRVSVKDSSKMHVALYDAKYYLLKYAGNHIHNADDAGAEKFASILRQIDEALKETLMKCKYCGCTDDHACEGGCSWVAKDVCSKCAAKLVTVIKNVQGEGALLKTTPLIEMRGEKPKSLFDVKHQELFVPVEALLITAENLLNTYQEITGEKIRLKLGAEPKKESEIRMIPALCPGCNKPIEICTGQFRLCVNRDHVKYPDPIWDPVKLRWADTPDEIEELIRRKP